MCLPEEEAPITLSQAAELCPVSVNVSTVWRWCVSGVGGVRLEHVRMGRRMLTSEDALRRFMDVLSGTAGTAGGEVGDAVERLARAGFAVKAVGPGVSS